MQVQAELTAAAFVVLAALFGGALCARVRLPPIVGYIIAGAILGPSGLAFVTDREQIGFLAELGVLLLLFTIGMQLSLRGFRAIWFVALGTALLQIIGATAIMVVMGEVMGWSLGVSVLLGFVVALSSTVVAVRILENLNLIRTQVGQITVSILIAQDLAVVPMIVIIRSFASGQSDVGSLAVIGAAVVFLGALIWYLSRRKKVQLPFSWLLVGQIDLRPVYALALCFGAASLSGFLQLTPAYGAFLAGLVVGNSNARNVMLRSIGPIQVVLIMMFFLSIGLLLDLRFLWDNLGTVVVVVLVVTVVKTAYNIGVIRLLGEPWPHALIAGLIIAQIGEFSFLIGQTGLDVGLISADDMNLIIAVTVVTLLISPVWLVTARRLIRLGFTGLRTWHEVIAKLRQGGFAGYWIAMRKAPPSERTALRYFGRPGTRFGRGLIAEKEADRPPAASSPQD